MLHADQAVDADCLWSWWLQLEMWKKTGKVQPGNCSSARSHLSKNEEPFQPFYDKHLAVPSSPSHKSSFCEAFMNRHHSAEKPRPATHSPMQSYRSSLILPDASKDTPQLANDLFSLMRTHELLARKSSLEGQRDVPDNAVALLEQRLKAYRDKWRDARQKLVTLKKKQVQLKEQVAGELGKWKKTMEKAVGELVHHSVSQREGAVAEALSAAKEFRGGEQRWLGERQAILQRFNTTLQRLI